MILLIDNYDSFTYNLVQLLREAGAEVEVLRNDALTAAEAAARGARGIVLSPGPGRPEEAGLCVDLFKQQPSVPILGVCLGHQCMGTAWGATVDRAEVLMHGKTSQVRYAEDPLFAGLPNPFQATRYHSLCVDPSTVPAELEPIAWSEDDTIMALRHRQRPYWGVQFHPESVLTHAGVSMLRNFLRLCDVEVSDAPPAPLVSPEASAASSAAAPSAVRPGAAP